MDHGTNPEKKELLEYEKVKEIVLKKAPFHNHLGMKIFVVSKGHSAIRITAEERLRNVGGVVHGGAIVSAADIAGFIALASVLDPETEKPETIELKVNFLVPVREGTIQAMGRVVHKGRNIAVCESDIFDGGGKLIAKSVGTYKVVRTN